MAIVIGAFNASKQGGRGVQIHTRTIDRRVRLVPNDDRVSDTVPAFRLMLGWQRIGDAWKDRLKGDNPRGYLPVRFEDPTLPLPRQAALFPDADGVGAQLVRDRAPS